MELNYGTETAKDGSPTLYIESAGKKVYLHSRYSPKNEKAELESPADFIILLGVGLGYQLEGIRDKLSTGKIIAIDALPAEKLIQDTDSSWLLERAEFLTQLTLDQIKEKLNQLLDINEKSTIKVVEHSASARALPEYYIETKKIISEIIRLKAGNLATKRAFGYSFLKNCIKKLPRLDRYRCVSELFGKFSGYDSIVVSSAPSLDQEIENIRRLAPGHVIIAVDSALQALIASGIRPDIMISIDPQPHVAEHIAGRRGIPAIIALSSWFDEDDAFLSLNSHPVSQIIEHALPGKIGSIDSKSGNVAGDALNAAILLGFRKIYLVGVDFSFPGFNIYARGTSYQRRFASIFSSRFKPVETLNADYITIKSKRVKKEGVFTRDTFIQYKIHLEERFREDKNVFRINPEGIKVESINELNSLSFINPVQLIDKEKLSTILLTNERVINNRDVASVMKLIDKDDMINSIVDESINCESRVKGHAKRFIRSVLS